MRRQRLVDLLLVLAVAFSRSLLISLYLFLSGSKAPNLPSYTVIQFIDGVLSELTGLILLVILLMRQGRSLQDLGFRYSWKDIPRTVLLWVVSSLAYSFLYYPLYYIFVMAHITVTLPANVQFLHYAHQGVNMLFAIPYSIINPFFEELIVRAYLITEIAYLTGRAWLAVLVSVVFQVSYHLYQGLLPALCYSGLFLVFSLYYVRSRRIVPIIFAHMIDDVGALFFYRA